MPNPIPMVNGRKTPTFMLSNLQLTDPCGADSQEKKPKGLQEKCWLMDAYGQGATKGKSVQGRPVGPGQVVHYFAA